MTVRAVQAQKEEDTMDRTTNDPRARVVRRLILTPTEVKTLTDHGISRQLISAWRNGHAMPGKDMAIRVARLTGRGLVEVLYGTTDVLTLDERMREVDRENAEEPTTPETETANHEFVEDAEVN